MFKKSIAFILSMSILLISCSSTTVLTTVPKGAKVYINDEYAGKTPYTYSDSRIIFSTNDVRIEKEGYETLYTTFRRDEEADVGAIVAGVFFVVPFFWAMKYKPTHNYKLMKLDSDI